MRLRAVGSSLCGIERDYPTRQRRPRSIQNTPPPCGCPRGCSSSAPASKGTGYAAGRRSTRQQMRRLTHAGRHSTRRHEGLPWQHATLHTPEEPPAGGVKERARQVKVVTSSLYCGPPSTSSFSRRPPCELPRSSSCDRGVSPPACSLRKFRSRGDGLFAGHLSGGLRSRD